MDYALLICKNENDFSNKIFYAFLHGLSLI